MFCVSANKKCAGEGVGTSCPRCASEAYRHPPSALWNAHKKRCFCGKSCCFEKESEHLGVDPPSLNPPDLDSTQPCVLSEKDVTHFLDRMSEILLLFRSVICVWEGLLEVGRVALIVDNKLFTELELLLCSERHVFGSQPVCWMSAVWIVRLLSVHTVQMYM